MIASTFTAGGSGPDWVVAAVAVGGFIVGSVWAPWHKESRAVREKAEKLAIESALRNQDVDSRLRSLLTVSERHEKAIDRLERQKQDKPRRK